MNIKDFFKMTAGNWFSQRTNYNLVEGKVDSSKAEIVIEYIDQNASEIIELCDQQGIESNPHLSGVKINWDNSPDWGKPKQKGFSLILLVPDPERMEQGKSIIMRNQTDRVLTVGRYILGDDRALTLTVEKNNFVAEERQWFASDNLRLRSSLLKTGTGITQTTFYSEIRRLA
jgi:phycoerythrin-associated linker protein